MQYRINTFENALDLLDTAVFLLNAKGVLYYSNAAGKKLLEKRDGLTEVSSCLVAVDRHAQTRFVKLMRSALVAMGAHGSVALPRQHSPRPLIARVMPVAQKSDFLVSEEKASAIVFVTDPDWLAGDAISEVMDTYGLTPSEKRLLNELLAGRSQQEAADILKIKHVTSRNRLARIMAKTNTHRQGELLQLMLRSSVPAGAWAVTPGSQRGSRLQPR